MEEKTKSVLMNRLDQVISHFALEDFKRANPKLKPGKKKKPYSLGYETENGMEIKNLIYSIPANEITQEDESKVKAYLWINRAFWKCESEEQGQV